MYFTSSFYFFFNNAIESLETKLKTNLNINIINNKNYSEIEYFKKFVDLIDEEGNYFNIIAINYKTKKEIISFFEYFNKDYKETCLTSSTYPFFLIDKNVLKKTVLYKEIKRINNEREDLYKYNTKDIIEYEIKSLPDKILGIYNYYFQRQEERKQQKTLNIMVCGKKRTGKTYFINQLLFENKGLSKENNYTTKITSYEHKLFPIMLFDFPGFSDNEDRGMIDATNYISKFSEEYQNLKNKIHIIFYMLQNDSGRVLQDKEIQLIEKFLKTNVPIFFITNRIQKNNYKSFIRNVEERMKHIKTHLKLEELRSHLFVLDSTNKSIKKLLDAVIRELNISKVANENIIKEFSKNAFFNETNKTNLDKNENLIDYEIIENPHDKEKEEIKRNYILELMKKSIFFNDYSKTFKKVQKKINEIIEKIQNESNTHLIPLLTAKNELIKLFNELKIEFNNFISEEKLEKNFPILEEINNDIKVDENSIGIIINSVICLLSVVAFGVAGTFSLAMGLPIYFITGKVKKYNIENLLKENADNMFKKFKEVSFDDNSIKKTAEEYNYIIEKFIQFSKYFDREQENDIDLLEEDK